MSQRPLTVCSIRKRSQSHGADPLGDPFWWCWNHRMLQPGRCSGPCSSAQKDAIPAPRRSPAVKRRDRDVQDPTSVRTVRASRTSRWRLSVYGPAVVPASIVVWGTVRLQSVPRGFPCGHMAFPRAPSALWPGWNAPSCSNPQGLHRHGRFRGRRGHRRFTGQPKKGPVQPKDGGGADGAAGGPPRCGCGLDQEARPQLFRLQEPRERGDVAHGSFAPTRTPASVHDSQRISALLDVSSRAEGPAAVMATVSIRRDDATLSAPWPRGSHAPAHRIANRPLTAQQEGWNTLRSKVRARVSTCSRASTSSAAADPCAASGLERAAVCLGLINLVHNLRRLMTMHRLATEEA